MTVSNKIPIVEYTGNGSVVKFDWDWDMIEDSSINVLLDNVNVTDWNLQDQSVVFDTAPDDGAEIQIYRRTLVYMPENYRAFGRFHSEKTELSVDRAIMIAQERAGDRGGGSAPNGIAGGANLSITRGEFDITLNSDRGADAVVPMWTPDDTQVTPGTPDPTIIWAGSDIVAGQYSLPGNTIGISASLRFRMDLLMGDPTEASAFYPNFNAVVYVSWLSVDPSDDEYWMRITLTNGLTPTRYTISDGDNYRTSGEEFQIRGSTVNSLVGPFINVYTYGDIAPSTRLGIFTVEICKDSGGVPDENWVSRIASMEAVFNS